MQLEDRRAGVPPIREARREMYRQQILVAAEHEFSKAGFDKVRMEAIAAAAGVSLATVYKTFAGKLDIWDALHAERMRSLLDSVEAATRNSPSALDRVLTGTAAVARYLTEHDDYLDLNLRAGSGWASSADGGRGVQRSVWSAGLDMIATGIEAALAEGTVRGIRPPIAAGMVVSALQVWLSDWVSSGRDRDPDVVIGELTLRLRWLLVGGTGDRPSRDA
jgi:AcrR family transcriptional regulator